MKRIMLITGLMIYSISLFAQTNVFNTTGNAGIGTLSPAAFLEINGGAGNEHIRISSGGHNESSSSFEYPALTYVARKDDAIQSITSQISFYDRPGTSGYPNAVRTSDIYFRTAHNWNGVAYGQYLDATMVLKATQDGGYVGIGNVNPTYKLDVNGTGRFTDAVTVNTDISASGRIIAGTNSFINYDPLQVNGNAYIQGNISGVAKISNNNYSTYSFLDLPYFNNNGWTFYTPNAAGNAAVKRFEVGNSADIVTSTFSNSNVVIADGKLLIGTSTPLSSYSLAVNGSAIFTKAVVKLYSNWPDYVFQQNYNLKSLDEIEKYITVNKHLPEIPSESEVAKNGIDLGNNQALLLKKIEELTLYTIELNKELQKVKSEIENLKNK